MKRISPTFLAALLIALGFYAYLVVTYVIVCEQRAETVVLDYDRVPEGMVRESAEWLHEPLLALDPRPKTRIFTLVEPDLSNIKGAPPFDLEAALDTTERREDLVQD